MSSRAYSLVIVLLLCASAVPQQSRQSEDSQKQALIAVEQRWLQAANDPVALESILADDFIHVLPEGFVTKTEQLKLMRANPPRDLPDTRHLEDLHVRIYGNIGIVNGVAAATARDRRAHRTMFTDVFAYRDGKWQAVNAQELEPED